MNQTLWLFAGIGLLLVVATLIGRLLAWRKGNNAVIANLNARIDAW